MVGTAGTVDTGAIDDLDALAAICRRERLWFHVDGACGALAMLAPDLAPRLKGIECADSLAFDFHKWGQVPYDAGFILVRDGVLHRKAFAASAAYLRKELRGLAARLALALRLRAGSFARLSGAEDLVHAQSVRHRGAGSGDFTHLRAGPLSGKPHRRNAGIGTAGAGGTQRGLLPLSRARTPSASIPGSSSNCRNPASVAPSTTILDGRLAIRAAIVNHRTGRSEIDLLVEKTVALGRAMEASAAGARAGSRRRTRIGRRSARGNPPCAISTAASRPIPAPWVCGSSSPVCSPRWAGPLEAQRRVSRCAGARALAPAGVEQPGHAAACHRISNRRAHRLRGSRGAPSRRSP